jgi:hypothetical protein
MAMQLLTVTINCCDHIAMIMCWCIFANRQLMSLICNYIVILGRQRDKICCMKRHQLKGRCSSRQTSSVCFVQWSEMGALCLVLWLLLTKNWWQMPSNQHDNGQERGVAVPCCHGSLALWRKREQPGRESSRHGGGRDDMVPVMMRVSFLWWERWWLQAKKYGCHLLTLTR